MASTTTLTLPVLGMDCASCASHVQSAVCTLDGVAHADVLVSAERAVVTFDPARVTRDDLVAAITRAGYSVPAPTEDAAPAAARHDLGAILGWGALGLVAAVVLVAALGEWLGLFDAVLDRLPWWIPAVAIALGGWPVLRGVVQAALQRRITSHTLMTVGVLAAIVVGEWTTAALIVFFMRFADWLEGLDHRAWTGGAAAPCGATAGNGARAARRAGDDRCRCRRATRRGRRGATGRAHPGRRRGRRWLRAGRSGADHGRECARRQDRRRPGLRGNGRAGRLSHDSDGRRRRRYPVRPDRAPGRGG